MNNSKKTITDIKTRLEANEQFQHYHKECGVTFEDFAIHKMVSEDKAITLKDGKKDIGDFCIFIKDDAVSVHYDLTVDDLRENRLDRIKEEIKS